MRLQPTGEGLITVRAFCFAFALALGLISAHGQDEKLVLNPPLSQIFPFEVKSGGVCLKFPVLLNNHTILGPDVVLRFIYVDSSGTEKSPEGGSGAGGGRRGGGHGGGVGGGGHHGGGGGDDDMPNLAPAGPADAPGAAAPPPNKALNNEMSSEVWTDLSLFREALDEAADVGTTLVYSVPGKTKPATAGIDLPDGAFVGEVNGQVQVLGLTENSRMFEAGVRPGDEIKTLGARPVSSLKEFSSLFYTLREQGQTSDHGYLLVVWRPSESRLVTIPVQPPPSLRPEL